MARKAVVETEFTGSDVSFMNAAARVEKRGQSLSNRLTGLFKRTPERRAEVALSGFASDLASGNVSSAITGLASRFSGLGLVVGVAIGAAVETFSKFQGQIEETRKAGERLHAELGKPLSLEAALGPEGITGQLEAATKATDEFIEKRKTMGSKFGNFMKDVALSFATGMSGTLGTSSGMQEDEIARGRSREKALSSARADAELKIVETRRIGLEVSEREGELAEIAVKAEQRRSKIALERSLTKPGRDATDLFKSLAAVSGDEKLSTDQANKKFDLKQKEAEMEERILDLIGNGKSLEDNRITALRERVNLLKQAESLEQTPEGARAARIKTRGAENELLQSEFKNRNAPGSALSTPETREAGLFQNFIKNRSVFGERNRTLDMSGNEIPNPAYARSPYAYDVSPQSGLTPTGGGAGVPGKKEGGSGTDIVAAVEKLTTTVEKIWGGN